MNIRLKLKTIIKAFLLFLIVFSFNSCKRDPPLFTISNLNGNVVSVFGHAGMGYAFEYPVDTYESIEPVLRIGADGSEMDLQLTKDSVLVVYHDFYLQDMTTCSTGRINDKLWSDIGGCHIASPISSSINLISFNQLMSKLTSSGKDIQDYIFTFDCKLYTNNYSTAFITQYANAVLKAIDDNGLQNNVYIESQDTNFLRILINKRSGLKLFIYPDDFESGFKIAKTMGLYGITTHVDHISASEIKQAHNSGIKITLWGVSTQDDNMRAVYKNPDFMQTDKPIDILKVFGKYK